MGACYSSRVFPLAKNEKQLGVQYRDMIDQLTSEYGTDSYNGTMSTCSGLSIESKQFKNRTDADRWIEENAHKRGPALAVKVLSCKPYRETASGKRWSEKVAAAADSRLKEKYQARMGVAESRYQEKKLAGKRVKFVWYVGAWCAE